MPKIIFFRAHDHSAIQIYIAHLLIAIYGSGKLVIKKMHIMDMSQIILLGILHIAIFSALGYFIGKQKEIGPIAGALLGILGIIGLIIVLSSRKKFTVPLVDQMQKYKQLFDNGLITDAEYLHLKGKLLESL
jgi:hypothetical protein